MIAGSAEAEIRRLSPHYANRVYRPHDQVGWRRRGPIRLFTLLVSYPPEAVHDLVYPIKVAAAMYGMFVVLTMGCIVFAR